MICHCSFFRVIESKNPDYPVGCRLVSYPGWRTHTLITAAQLKDANVLLKMHKLFPEMGDYPLSTALGVLGMPGLVPGALVWFPIYNLGFLIT